MLKTAKINSKIEESICRGHFYIAQKLLYADFQYKY